MTTIETQVQLPNDETHRKMIKDAIQESVDSKLRASAERTLQSEISKEIFEKTGFSKKHFNKLVRARVKDGISKEVAEMSDLEAVYDILYLTPNNTLSDDNE